jgi:hypothetical protein
MLVKNVNVWGMSKYHDFSWMANQSDPLQKNKVELWYEPTTK